MNYGNNQATTKYDQESRLSERYDPDRASKMYGNNQATTKYEHAKSFYGFDDKPLNVDNPNHNVIITNYYDDDPTPLIYSDYYGHWVLDRDNIPHHMLPYEISHDIGTDFNMCLYQSLSVNARCHRNGSPLSINESAVMYKKWLNDTSRGLAVGAMGDDSNIIRFVKNTGIDVYVMLLPGIGQNRGAVSYSVGQKINLHKCLFLVSEPGIHYRCLIRI